MKKAKACARESCRPVNPICAETQQAMVGPDIFLLI